jgi:hypothetical protein
MGGERRKRGSQKKRARKEMKCNGLIMDMDDIWDMGTYGHCNKVNNPSSTITITITSSADCVIFVFVLNMIKCKTRRR